LGDLSINGRRGRKEEFNPFAKDASQQHRRRREDRERQHARRPAAPVEAPVNQPKDIKADLERKQREAIEKLVQKGDVAVPVEAEKKKEEKPLVQSHEDRLAELRRKSEEAKMSASRIEAAPELASSIAPTVTAPASVVESDLTPNVSSLDTDDQIVTPAKRAKNVFAKIETKVEVKQDRRRGRRRMDKKGGGRQKQEKKLNRQKYLEYKYAAKDILDNPNVPEEHRSNVLGQIWAKGERQGIDDCLEYIDQKEAELILPESVGAELKNLVKRMTTKR
jgi:hypothetical protein